MYPQESNSGLNQQPSVYTDLPLPMLFQIYAKKKKNFFNEKMKQLKIILI